MSSLDRLAPHQRQHHVEDGLRRELDDRSGAQRRDDDAAQVVIRRADRLLRAALPPRLVPLPGESLDGRLLGTCPALGTTMRRWVDPLPEERSGLVTRLPRSAERHLWIGSERDPLLAALVAVPQDPQPRPRRAHL